MCISFDEVFTIFREMCSREDTWFSIPTPNYISEAIIHGPYQHGYVPTHVSLDYEYTQPRRITSHCIYKYDPNFNITDIRLNKVDVFKLEVCRTDKDDNSGLVGQRLVLQSEQLRRLMSLVTTVH